MGTHSSSRPRLGDFSTAKRLLLLTPMAAVVGVISSVIAYVLVWLIGRSRTWSTTNA